MRCRQWLFNSALILFTLNFFITGTWAHAELTSPEEARLVCSNWLNLQTQSGAGWSQTGQPSIIEQGELIVEGEIAGYFFNLAPKGFVVIPALKAISPIKACSDNGYFDPNQNGLAEIIVFDLSRANKLFSDAFGDLSATPSRLSMPPFSEKDAELWDLLTQSSVSFETQISQLSLNSRLEGLPLLQSTWHQGAPYNDLTPAGDTSCSDPNCIGPGGHTLVGCVATATAQVMFYHQWPPSGTDSHSYWWNGDDSCGSNVGAQTLTAMYSDPFDWANMTGDVTSTSPQAAQNAVAELCYEVAVAFEMDFGVCGSSASTFDAMNVLPDFFQYEDDIARETRSDFSAEDWFNLIAQEIDRGRPLIYRVDRHAIVCDGWRISGGINQYHMNYGWDDGNTTWYTIDNLILDPPDDEEYLLSNIRPTNTITVGASSNPVPQYGSIVLSALLVDEQGAPVANEDIEFYSLVDGSFFGGNVAGHIATTGGNGIAPVNFSPSAPPGTAGKVYARCIANPGVQGEILLLIAGASGIQLELRVTMTERADTYSRYRARVDAKTTDGQAVDNEAVSFTTSLGNIESQDFYTDQYGKADCIIYTENSGDAIITASVLDGIAQQPVQFNVGPLPPLVAMDSLDYSQGGIGSWTWSPDGKNIAIGSQDNERVDIRLVGDWSVIQQIHTDEGNVDGVAYSPDGSQMVLAANGAFEIYNVGTGALIRSTENPDGNDDSRFISWNDNNVIISEGSFDSYVKSRVLRLDQNLNVVRSFARPDINVRSYGYSDAVDKVWVNSSDFLDVYNVGSSNPIWSVEILDVEAAGFNPSGTKIIANRDNDWLYVFNAANGSELCQITDDFSGEFVSFDWSVHEDYIAGIDDDGTLWVIHYNDQNNSGYVVSTASNTGGSDAVVKWNPEGFLLAVETDTHLNFFSPLDFDGPQAGLDYPPNGLETTEDSILVEGWATDLSGINRAEIEYETGTAVDYDLDDGEFEFDIPLAYGSNSLCLMVFDNTLHETVVCRTVHRTLTPPANFQVTHLYDEPERNELTWSYPEFQSGMVFRVYRSTIENFTPSSANMVNESTEMSWEDTDTPDTYFYKLSVAIQGVVESEFVNPGAISGAEQAALPDILLLHPNHPNPFNPSTTLRFSLPKDSFVKLSVYDLSGMEISTLVKETLPAGHHSVRWNGVNSQGKPVGSGVYLYVLDTGKKQMSGRMALIK